MTWCPLSPPILIFTECAIVTCDNASVPVSTSVRVCVCASYTRSETQAYVCYHGSHNRCDFRANLLRCYGDGNLTEGGRKTEREGWDSKRKKEGGDGTYYYWKYGTTALSSPICQLSVTSLYRNLLHLRVPGHVIASAFRHLLWTFSIMRNWKHTVRVQYWRLLKRFKRLLTSPGPDPTTCLTKENKVQFVKVAVIAAN